MPEIIHLAVDGMTCAACVSRVEKALGKIEGVKSASVSLASHSARIEGDATPPALIEAIENAGYDAKLLQSDYGSKNSERAIRRELQARIAAIAGLLLCLPFIASMVVMAFGTQTLLSPAQEVLLASILQFGLGMRFYKGTWKALRGGAATMDVLVALGTTAAYGLSFVNWQITGAPHTQAANHMATMPLYFESSSVVIGFVLFGKWLEERAMAETTASLRALQALQPDDAQIIDTHGTVHRVATITLREGMHVLVNTGERIPADGHIIEGFADIDEAMVTGESLPVAKRKDDGVIGGTLNTDGRLVIALTSPPSQSVLAKIITAMEAAQASKAPVQKRVDRVTEIFVPTIVAIALITLGAWLFVGADRSTALLHAISVLVIACPCALGLATPTALIAGTGLAARNSLLLRNAAAIEALAKTQVVVFDKTGTLTTGLMAIQDIITLGARNESDCLHLAASLESASPHPLARALLLSLKTQMPDTQLAQVNDFKSISGAVCGNIEGTNYILGNERALSAFGFDFTAHENRSRHVHEKGLGLSWLGALESKQLLALFSFADSLRPTSRAAIGELKSMGIETIMLTGDNRAAANRIGGDLGVKEVIAEVTPQQKALAITELQKRGLIVAMVGDGINDAPALTTADCGIAMAQGTDIAMEASAVTLMQADPQKISTAILIARQIVHTIQRGLFFAFIYNVIGIPLAALGYLSPMIAGGAMALSSVSVVTNALTLRLYKPKNHTSF